MLIEERWRFFEIRKNDDVVDEAIEKNDARDDNLNKAEENQNACSKDGDYEDNVGSEDSGFEGNVGCKENDADEGSEGDSMKEIVESEDIFVDAIVHGNEADEILSYAREKEYLW